MSKRIMSILMALSLLCGCGKTAAETPKLPEEQEIVSEVTEETEPRKISTDWDRYQLSFQLTESKILTQYGHRIFRQQVGWLDVEWIIDLEEETPLSPEELYAIYKKAPKESTAGSYSGVYYPMKNGTEHHFYLSDGKYQICLIGFAEYADWTQASYEEEIATMEIQQGDFHRSFSLSDDEAAKLFMEKMETMDILLDYTSRQDYSAIPLDGLDTVTVPCNSYRMLDPGPWLTTTYDAVFAEVTEENFGEDFPWSSTEDIRDTIRRICGSEYTALESYILGDDSPAFRDIGDELYFNSDYNQGWMLTTRDMSESWDMDTLEILQEENGKMYLYLERLNDGRRKVLIILTKDTDGQWYIHEDCLALTY